MMILKKNIDWKKIKEEKKRKKEEEKPELLKHPFLLVYS
jgi:hypothetical protein